MLPHAIRIPGIKDLTAEEREALFGEITRVALRWHVASVDPSEIDRINIHQAHCWPCARRRGAYPAAGFVLVDGFRIPHLSSRSGRGRRRPQVDRHRGRVDSRQGHARPIHGPARTPTIRATASTATKATPRLTISRRSPNSATQCCTGGRSGRRRCLIPSSTEAIIRFFSRLLVAAYLIEAGVLLVLAPWSALWQRNYFAAHLPMLGQWMMSPYAKGAVTGVGLITALGGSATSCPPLCRANLRPTQRLIQRISRGLRADAVPSSSVPAFQRASIWSKSASQNWARGNSWNL